MKDRFAIRLFLILSVILACSIADTVMAAQLWISPTELNMKYSWDANVTSATVSVINYDMDDNTFTWTAASADADWIRITTPDTVNTGAGSFTVSLDPARLNSMAPGVYKANISVYSSIGPGFVTVSLDNQLPVTEEQSTATSSWLDIRLQVPDSYIGNDDMYVLMEHPTLLPGMVYAYRCSPNSTNGAESDCRLDLFSEWGHLVPDAADMYYDSDQMLEETTGMVEVPFAGFRAIGLEGDLVITAITGLPEPGMKWGKRQLVKHIVHIVPVTGEWIVTENLGGQTVTYNDPANPAITYPMVLFEDRGYLAGNWQMPWSGTSDFNISYGNPDDRTCSSFGIDGSRISFDQCGSSTLYQVAFTATTVLGDYDYLYEIKDIEGSGQMSGMYKWKLSGTENWQVPQKFTAVTQSVMIPLNPYRNDYMVNGKVNGYAVPFIVDTGASIVYLSSSDAQYMGVNLDDPNQCVPGTVTGVGGSNDVMMCLVNIEIEGKLSKQSVVAAFSATWEGPALLGMTFLDSFHVSTSSTGGTMIIAP